MIPCIFRSTLNAEVPTRCKMSTSSTRKPAWTETDIIEEEDIDNIGSDSVENDDQQQQIPQKVILRRRSARISQKRLADGNDTQSESNGPPTKRGKRRIAE